MLSWKEFNSNTAFEYTCKNRATRLRMYKNYVLDCERLQEKMHTHSYSEPIQLGVGETITWEFDTPAPDLKIEATKPSEITWTTLPKGSFDSKPVSGFSWKNPINKEEGNNPMHASYATATVQAATTETQDQRKYLQRRLDDIFYEKERPLYALFGLVDDDAPQTPKELKKRIEDGMFTINGLPKDGEDDEDDFEELYFGYWPRLIRWRDPAKKADQDGYEAARKELKAEYQKAMDTIKIDDVKAGLDAVKALEDWKPTGAAN